MYIRPDLNPIYRAYIVLSPTTLRYTRVICPSLASLTRVHLSCCYYSFNIISIIVGVQF